MITKNRITRKHNVLRKIKTAKKLIKQYGGMKKITEEEKLKVKENINKILNDYMNRYIDNIKQIKHSGVLIEQAKVLLTMRNYYVDLDVLHDICNLLLETYEIEENNTVSKHFMKSIRKTLGRSSDDECLQFLHKIIKTQRVDDKLPGRIAKLAAFLKTNIYTEDYIANLTYMPIIEPRTQTQTQNNKTSRKAASATANSDDTRLLEELEREYKIMLLQNQVDQIKSEVNYKIEIIKNAEDDQKLIEKTIGEAKLLKAKGLELENEITELKKLKINKDESES